MRPAQTAVLVTRRHDSNQRPLHHNSTDAEARELAPKVPNILARSTGSGHVIDLQINVGLLLYRYGFQITAETLLIAMRLPLVFSSRHV